jgi:serine/threonine-protein kinase
MDAAFCAGFSDTIRGDLAEIETGSKNSLWVVPSAEVRGIKTASQAYREVGANLVLAATLHRTEAGVSLTAELVDAKDRRLLKSATIEVDTLPALRNAAVTRIAALLDIPVAKAMTREMAASSTSEPGAFEYYEQGLGYLEGGSLRDVDQAIGLFKKALEKDQEYALAYAGLGEAYAKKYKWTKDSQWVGMAVQNGNRAIRMNGSLAQVHSTMGVTYSMTGHSDLALAELQKAVQIEPACMLCFHHLGDAYLTRGQLDEAEKSYAEITRNQRGNVLGYSGLAKVAEMRGDLPKAEQMYRHALNLAPDRASAAANLGGIYIEMGRNEDAIPVLLKALSMQPSGDAYSNLGAAYMYLGRYPEAADAMEHAVQLTPNDHDYWRNLADSYRQVPALRNKADGAYRKALQLAQAALAVKPGDVDLLSSMGLYYAHLGDTRKAETFTEQALKKAPDNSQVLFTSALAAELTGRRKKALNLLAASAKAGYAVSLIEKEPELISLQSDPDYRQWVEKVREPGTVSH